MPSRFTVEARPRKSHKKWKRYARHERTGKFQPYGSAYWVLRKKKFSGVFSEAQADSFSRWAHARGLEVRIKLTRSGQRERGVEWQNWAVENERAIHYSQKQSERMNLDRMVGKKLPLAEDCSSTTIGCHKYAGAPDPTGNGYNPSAVNFTGTLLTGSKPISFADLKPMSQVIYGPGSGNHVCMVNEIRPDGNHILFSHGQERGPILISMRDEAAFQPGPVRYRDAIG